ncbi:hypothetical protein N7456_001004 [Penicillium angulare]|uniref:F-box domain-containing protein n=1 Tax=Penicillium angulare TaxID=116970 RepID=A0A9W9KSW0_9EURO|nr:hypothetical protein N7456_001004 [Penicillium angulare]
MDQFWRVIAPERKEVTGCLGELVEALLSGSASNLVPLLAVPLHTHSESLEVLPGENIEDEKEEYCTRRTRKSCLSSTHLTKIARIEKHDSDVIIANAHDERTKSFHSLPSKLHFAIFNLLDDIQDILCLSLASRYFWAIGLTQIEDHIVMSSAPWAGERIMCVSDRIDPRDYPPGLLSPTEKEDLAELNRVHNLNTMSINHTWKKVGETSLSQKLQEWFRKYEAQHPMREADRTEILTGLRPEMLDFYPRDQPWILRNLTTNEYVRGEAIALKDAFIHGPHIDVIGFSEVLLSRISWSSQPVMTGHGRNLSHGKWAGHRFDITPLANLHSCGGISAWDDVSNELLRELDIIVTSQKGDDWREQLSQRYRKVTCPVALGYT